MESDKDEQTNPKASEETPAPMNRAERRALEHKKGKATPAGGPQNPFGSGQSRPSGRFAGGPDKGRLPRTGHK